MIENNPTQDQPVEAVVHRAGTGQDQKLSSAPTTRNPNDTVTGFLVIGLVLYLVYRFIRRK